MRLQFAWVWVAVAIAASVYKAGDIRRALSTTGESWARLHPDVQARALRVLRDAQAEGLSVGIYEGWRDTATQARYIEQGVSKTSVDGSYHVWGLAVDFVFLDGLGRWTWLPTADNTIDARWYQLGAIIERAGFEWGGRFKTFFDGPHAQLPLLTVNVLRTAYGSPDNLSWQVA